MPLTAKSATYPVGRPSGSRSTVPHARSPEPVVTRLREAAKAAASDPAFLAALARVQTPLQYLDQPQFRAFWDADAKKLEGVVQRIGKVE